MILPAATTGCCWFELLSSIAVEMAAFLEELLAMMLNIGDDLLLADLLLDSWLNEDVIEEVDEELEWLDEDGGEGGTVEEERSWPCVERMFE